MSLRTSVKTDIASATGGVWFDLEAHPNKDGTIPGFLLGQQSQATNPRFAAAMQKLANRAKPAGKQLTIQDGLKADCEVFVGGILLDWRYFEPDEDDVKVPYGEKAASEVFNSPAWIDLKGMLIERSHEKTNYNVGQRELAAKNSSASSVSTSTADTGTKTQSTRK